MQEAEYVDVFTGETSAHKQACCEKTEVDATQPLRLTQTAYVQLCKSNQ